MKFIGHRVTIQNEGSDHELHVLSCEKTSNHIELLKKPNYCPICGQKLLVAPKNINTGNQTCPRRMNEAGPWKYKTEIDCWEIRPGNELRTCSFCGSVHPQDFLKILGMIISKEDGYSIEPTTKTYKYYARTSKNHYKFYTMHLQKDVDGVNDAFLNELNEKFHEALKISNEKFNNLIKGGN